MRGIANGHDLRVWHDVYVDGVSDLMTPEDAYAGALMGFGECLMSGVTTVMSDTIDPEAEARAAQEIGIRARFFAHVIHEEETDRYFELLRSQGGTEEDLVRFWVGLEVPSASSSQTRRRARQHADSLGLRIHTHFSEDKRGSIDELIQDGFMGPDLHMAHCVQVTSEDIDQLAKYGVKVAHCPTSNLKLANGIAPVPEMRARGISVGIATDGLISTGRIDLFEQMRVAGLIQRGLHRNPKILPGSSGDGDSRGCSGDGDGEGSGESGGGQKSRHRHSQHGSTVHDPAGSRREDFQFDGVDRLVGHAKRCGYRSRRREGCR